MLLFFGGNPLATQSHLNWPVGWSSISSPPKISSKNLCCNSAPVRADQLQYNITRVAWSTRPNNRWNQGRPRQDSRRGRVVRLVRDPGQPGSSPGDEPDTEPTFYSRRVMTRVSFDTLSRLVTPPTPDPSLCPVPLSTNSILSNSLQEWKLIHSLKLSKHLYWETSLLI